MEIDLLKKSLSAANDKISKLKPKSIPKLTPETNEDITKLRLEIDSLKKSLSESNETIIKLQLEIDSSKKSLIGANETITKLQSEKAEILDNVKNTLQKYNLRYIHGDNMLRFNNIIKNNEFHKLLNFEKFDLKLLFKDIIKIRDMKDKIILHIIDNFINLEEINKNDGNYKLIHYFVRNGVKFDIIKYLIDKNIDLSYQNIWGNTPLHYACSYARKNIIEYLIEKIDKVDIKNNDKKTPVQILGGNHLISNDEKKSLIMKFEAKQ